MKETIFDLTKKKVGEADLAEDIFGEKPNKALIYETVKNQLTNKRQGNASCKNRALVSGSTKKIYRQKGTGRARHSSATANIFVGGGKAFGPHPKDYTYTIPKKVRRQSLKAALAMKQQEGNLVLIKELSVTEPKTAPLAKMLKNLGVTNGLFVVEKSSLNLKKSMNNIPRVQLTNWDSLNVLDIMKHEHLVMTTDALNKVQEMLKS
ncbi:MAG: 50S ribosomal protein L4 [Pseudomonadota bacterium]